MRDASKSPELAALSVKEYVDLVNSLTQLAPLVGDVRNLSFHAQLLTGQYDQLELLGDQLLKERGSIKIPFFSYQSFFWLVIDSQRKHIYTEADSHPFDVSSVPKKWSWAELVPFDLAFDQIKNISQKGEHGARPDYIAFKSYALKFDPGGVAPDYALMNILYCSAGEKAELTVTRNLGQYILHVIGGNSVRAQLADPSKMKGPSGGWSTGLMMMAATMSTSPSLATAAVQYTDSAGPTGCEFPSSASSL